MFNDETRAALHAWLAPSTWHTLHALDERRFFGFVHAVWREKRGLWDELAVRDVLLQESRSLDPEFNEDNRERVIDARQREAVTILQFLAYLDENGLEP